MPDRRPAPPPYAVVDIDGVVADVRHRLHHVQRRRKNWAAFFAEAADDPLLPEGQAVARRLAEDHELVYLSGRPESLRPVTHAWLRRHELPDGRLLLRRHGDRRPAALVKVEILRSLAAQRPVDVLVDDDPQVVEAVERAGFTVLHAGWGRPTEPALDAALEEAQERSGRT